MAESPVESKVALITGASSGFGRLMADLLPSAGHIPVASMREPDGRNEKAAAELAEADIDVVGIDVTDHDSVAGGVAKALEKHGRIDVLVNNAGFGVMGPAEAVTIDDLRLQFETNVLGAHRMVRAVLPAMRQQGEGLLIHVSSGAGRLALPGAGAYCASKWALEALAEVLRYELAPLGIDSVIVEPGPYATDFADRAVIGVSDHDRAEFYEHVVEGGKRRAERTTQRDPKEVVDVMMHLIDMPFGTRPPRVVVHPLREVLEKLNNAQWEAQKEVLRLYE